MNIDVNKVVSYKPREEQRLDLGAEERAYYNEGFKVLHKKTKSEPCSAGYYQQMIKMFSGGNAKYFLSVVTRLETDYKGYQMPTRKEFEVVLSSIKRDEQTRERLKAPRLEYDPTLDEDEKSDISNMIDEWCKKHK